MKSVVAGNGKAEVFSRLILPLLVMLGIMDAGEQPSTSKLFNWPGHWAVGNWDWCRLKLGKKGALLGF